MPAGSILLGFIRELEKQSEEERVLLFKVHLVHKRVASTCTESGADHKGSRGARWTCCHPNSVPRHGQGLCPLPGSVGGPRWDLIEVSSGRCQSFPL